MTHIENINVGDWIAILDVPEEQEANPFDGMSMFFGHTKKRPAYSVTGKPLKVLAICAPFVSVSDGSIRFPLDSRNCSFTKLDKKYVETLTVSRTERHESSFGIPETQDVHRKKRKKEKPGIGFCPRCGEKLVERLTTSNLGVWMWVCKRCGFMGGGPDGSNVEKPRE